jgi:2-C-methyl-D-erythritol 4-phosphate cytidylyltransferase
MNIKAVLLLGGLGTRVLGEKTPKQFLLLGDKKIYEITLETFEKSNLFKDIILVSPQHHQIKGSVAGGQTRQQSSFNGLQACGPQTDFVLIHDAVRPFVSIDILKRNVEAAQKYGAVNTCIPSADTLNVVKKGFTTNIPNRNELMRGQTPQTFSFDLILEAHKRSKQTNAFDDCSLVLEMGKPVFVVDGSFENFKITTDFDYLLAKTLYANNSFFFKSRKTS